MYNENEIMIKSDLDTDTIKKTLAGLADGSFEIGENGIRRTTKTESSVTSTNEEGTQVSSIKYHIKDDVLSWNIDWDSDNFSSIKSQLLNHFNEVNSMQPVTSVVYDKNDGKPYYEQLNEILRDRFGYKIERQDNGIVIFDSKAVDGMRKYVASDAEAAAVIAAPYILKRGKAISGHRNHKEQGYPSVIYAAPAILNGEIGNVAVSVLYGDGKRVHSLRVLAPNGKEFILSEMKNTELQNGDSDTKSVVESPINSVLDNSIPQNSEKSTENAEKDERKFLADEEEGKKASSQDARKRSLLDDNAKGDGEGESEAKRASEREYLGKEPENMTDRERKRGYTDNEANTARALVKDFDVLSREKRIAIIEMIRSAEACKAKKSFMKHAAAMIGYWRKGLYIIADNKTSEKGFYQTFDDGSRLIVVNPNSSVKNAINVAFVHELAHDIWAKATDKTKDTLYRMATESATAAEVEDIRKEYTDGYEKRGLKINDDVLREEVFTNLIGKTLGNEAFLERFDITPGRMTAFKRSLKAVTRMAKCFFGKNKYLYSRTEKMARSLIRVMGAQLATETVSENGKRFAVNVSNEDYAEYNKPITLADIEVLRSIGRKSVNEFTAEDIKKTQKWAYKFYKELGVKSPFFRAWFGDWRAYDRKSAAETIDIPQGVKINTTNRRIANKDTKWQIQITDDLVQDSLHYAKKDYLYIQRMLSHIDEIVSKAILLDTQISDKNNNNKKGSSEFMHYLYAVVEFQGAPFLAKITVEEYNAGIGYRAYNAQRIKMSTLSRAQYSQLKTAYRGKNASSVDAISVADLFEIVNRYDKEFNPKIPNENLVEKETGEPIKLYHGTQKGFNEFKYSELSIREGSFFFAQNREDAEAYAGRDGDVMEVYVSLKKPIDYNNMPTEIYRLKDKKAQVEALKELGYDGWYCDMEDGWGEVSAFYPVQIKSATNNIGTFDGNNPNIRYSFDPEAFIDQAIRNGFGENVDTEVKSKTEKSQTSDNTKAELKEAQKEVRGLRKANERLSNTVVKAQEKSRELREENKQLKKDTQASEVKAKNAEKKSAAEKERMEKKMAIEAKKLAAKLYLKASVSRAP